MVRNPVSPCDSVDRQLSGEGRNLADLPRIEAKLAAAYPVGEPSAPARIPEKLGQSNTNLDEELLPLSIPRFSRAWRTPLRSLLLGYPQAVLKAPRRLAVSDLVFTFAPSKTELGLAHASQVIDQPGSRFPSAPPDSQLESSSRLLFLPCYRQAPRCDALGLAPVTRRRRGRPPRSRCDRPRLVAAMQCSLTIHG